MKVRIQIGVTALLLATVSTPLVAAPMTETDPLIEVSWHGKALAYSPAYLRTLRTAVEQLAEGALYAEQAEPPATSTDLVILVRYEAPLSLKLPTREAQSILVRQLYLATSSEANSGWPVLFASTTETSWFLAKYSGPLALEILCTPELESYAPAAIRSSCQLAPGAGAAST
ncbi:MAG: hypothetical protein AAB011_07635 [Candidatus Eisenbacteria bacterium]